MTTWRLALRTARREALRNKGRSVLVAAMIALPVAGAGAGDTLWHSSQVSPAQTAAWDMGGFDAAMDVIDLGGPVVQNPKGDEYAPDTSKSGVSAPAAPGDGTTPTTTTTTTTTTATATPITGSPAPTTPIDRQASDATTLADVRALLPAGSRIAGPWSAAGSAIVSHGRGRTWANLRGADLTDPLTRSMYRLEHGTAPTRDDQVAVNDHLARTLGKGVGDTVSVTVPSVAKGPGPVPPPTVRTLTITGVYEDPRSIREDVLFERPGVGDTDPQQPRRYYLSVPGGVSWDLVRRLNAAGVVVESKQVVTDPPPDSAVPYYAQNPRLYQSGSTLSKTAVSAAIVAVSMILLEVVLLAGPAFAVSARRRRRDFGLLGAAGADGPRLRRIVLADGVVLGLAGGVAGVVIGVAAGWLALPLVAGYVDHEPGGFHVAPLELAAAAAVGVFTGLVAATAPAITTARQDVLTALTGRRGQAAAPWKLPLLGLAGVVAGTALVFYAAFSSGVDSVPMVAGICLGELGLVACTPVLVAWSGRLARFLPLSGRLALRDGARNRGRTAPAVAAVMAAVAGASAMAVVLASNDARGRGGYLPMVRPGVAEVYLSGDPTGQAASFDTSALVAKVGAQLPVRQAAIEYQAADGGGMVLLVRTAGNQCPQSASAPVGVLVGGTQGDPRCSGMGIQPASGGGPELLRALTGTSEPAAEAVLAAGGAVVFHAADLATPAPNATVQLEQIPPGCPPDGSPDPHCADRTVTVPAALVAPPTTVMTQTVIVAPTVLEKLGVHPQPATVYFDTTRMPTAAEEQKADDAAGSLGLYSRLYVERGYQSNTFVGLLALSVIATIVTLGAAAVATGLAITDAQGDLETLVAVGARPRVRRSLAGAQAAVTAGLGALLGALFGLVPAAGLIEARAHAVETAATQAAGRAVGGMPSYLSIPWSFLAVVVLALPVLAAVGASGLTRSRIVLGRRRA